jgi:hypothetical protein
MKSYEMKSDLATCMLAVELAWADVVSSANRRGTPWGEHSPESAIYEARVRDLLAAPLRLPADLDLARALFA